MRQPWEAAEILEEILRIADPVAARRRMYESLTGTVKSDGPAQIDVHFCAIPPPSLEITYHYLASAIMGGMEGDLQEVVDLLKTGLRSGEEAWIGDSEQVNEKEVVIKVRFTDPTIISHYRTNMKW